MLDNLNNLFLPFQKKWINDDSRFKLYQKTRRAGITWCEAFKSVDDCLTKKIRNKPLKVYFTSSNFDNSIDFIGYCKEWTELLNVGLEDSGIKIIDNDGTKMQTIRFKNGAEIVALSSNPKALRGKGGKLIIDEFAFHDNQSELWKAAKPVVTWGYPLVIISSLNGKEMFYRFIEKIEQGKLNWSMHKTDIFQAVDMGLVDKILDKKTTKKERQTWLEEEKNNCFDEVTWLQEYCCIAVDEATSFLSYELISNCIEETLIDDLNKVRGELYVGYDVARRKDLSTVYIFEKLGSVFYLRKSYELKNVKFKEQKEIMRSILSLPNCMRCAIDQTGIGAQMAEELKDEFGSRKVEPVTFTSKAKEELAYKLLYAFQDKNIRIPDDEKLKNDLHSVKRISTSTDVIRFDVERSETDGHADRFWAIALAIFAGVNKPYVKAKIKTANFRNSRSFNREFNFKGLGRFLRGI